MLRKAGPRRCWGRRSTRHQKSATKAVVGGRRRRDSSCDEWPRRCARHRRQTVTEDDDGQTRSNSLAGLVLSEGSSGRSPAWKKTQIRVHKNRWPGNRRGGRGWTRFGGSLFDGSRSFQAVDFEDKTRQKGTGHPAGTLAKVFIWSKGAVSGPEARPLREVMWMLER